jgi:hypothetical protein
MPDPITLITLVSTSVLGALTLVLNIFQSAKSDHFSLVCSDCCTLETSNNDDE